MLPLARLAKPGETPSNWDDNMLHFRIRYGLFKKRQGKGLSMTPNAIRLRAMREGKFTPKTKEQRSEALKVGASERVKKGWITRKAATAFSG